MFYGGIDGGGSSTSCVILDQQLKQIGQGQAGPANLQLEGAEKVIVQIKTALGQACRKAGISKIDVLGIGLAGAGRAKGLEVLLPYLATLTAVSRYYITDDGKAALLGAYGGQAGIIVIAGTGSIVYGMKEDGSIVRAGGWGPILGDEGSGYWIGYKTLQAIIQGEEKRSPIVPFKDKILDSIAINRLEEELVPYVHQKKLPRKEIASLARIVIAEFEKGDMIARGIIESGLEELARTVAGMVDNYQLKTRRVVLLGGLFQNKRVKEIFSKMLTGYDNYSLSELAYSPAYGAALFGKNMNEKIEVKENDVRE